VNPVAPGATPVGPVAPEATPTNPVVLGAGTANPVTPGTNPGEASAAPMHHPIAVDDQMVCSPEYCFLSDAKSSRPHLLTIRFL